MRPGSVVVVIIAPKFLNGRRGAVLARGHFLQDFMQIWYSDLQVGPA
jgi:hypothetical protein